MRARPAVCPKCRTLGLATDCSESIGHVRKARTMSGDYGTEPELIVTITFAIPVPTGEEDHLRETATRLHDEWINDPESLIDALREASEDYDLQVKPLSEA